MLKPSLQALIRPVSLEDLQGLWQLSRQTNFITWTQEHFIEDFRKNDVVGFSLVVKNEEKEETIGGFIWGHILASVEAELHAVAVEPCYQGLGFGKKLVQHFCLYCQKSGVEKVFLEVACTNKKAIRLYEDLGFVQQGIRPGYYHQDGQPVDGLNFFLSLA